MKTFDLYRIIDNHCGVDELKAAFEGERLWYNCNCLDYSAIIATLDENEPFAVINYYCGHGWMYDDYLVDVNNARNKEWVKSRLLEVIQDQYENEASEDVFDEYKNGWKAEVRIYKCFTNQDYYYNDEKEKVYYDFADIEEIENFDVELN